ncbi:MAG: hypothetical protein E7111_08765 [Bacteroidales bacterium]|nr:hypothetical protein [Bacteroidales bacterium]
MKSKLFLIIYAVVIALLAVGLVVFMCIHISKGLAGGNAKLILGAYILMIVWALMKLHTAIRSIKNYSDEKE